MDHAFFVADGDALVATPSTRGPWDNRFQHGGPPSALLVGAMERVGEDAADFQMARITVELLRPVPIGRLELRAEVERSGRSVQHTTAELHADGKRVARARGLRIRRVDVDLVATRAAVQWPAPDEIERFILPFFQHDIGYHLAVDLRVARGAWGGTPVGLWARPLVELVDGRESTPLERLIILADAQSGMGPPLDPRRFTFVNPDLTAYLARPPVGSWFGFDITAALGAEGAGLSQSAVRDEAGLLGRTAQSLVVAPRS